MNEFHVVLEASPEDIPTSSNFIELCGNTVPTLLIPQQGETRFQRSFEEVAEEVSALPRMYFELDGSFVWVVETQGQRYQLDGSLYDDGVKLLNVDLKGICDEETLETFLRCLGWPNQEIVFQLVQRGVYLTEESFRRCFI